MEWRKEKVEKQNMFITVKNGPDFHMLRREAI